MTDVTMRRATVHDVAAMAELVDRAYRPYVARIHQEPAPMAADYAVVVAEAEAWVGERDGHLVGLLVLYPLSDHLLLDNIAVDPSVQGTGIGNRLLQLADQRAAELGLPEIRLYTNVAMAENLAYYPRHGYRETHRATQDGYERVFFTKPVESARSSRP